MAILEARRVSEGIPGGDLNAHANWIRPPQGPPAAVVLDTWQGHGGPSQMDLSYKLAARMQLAASEALDISKETLRTREAYGIGREPKDSYGRRCLIARRLGERGVRFVQLSINSQIWDTHNNIGSELKSACDRTDLPTAALLRDLKQRGLLDSTLVVWGGEFGRLPIAQLPPDKDEHKAGRDHFRQKKSENPFDPAWPSWYGETFPHCVEQLL